MIDFARLSALAANDTLSRAERTFGLSGSQTVRDTLEAVHRVYKWLAYETLSGGLVVFRTIDPAARPRDPATATSVAALDQLPSIARTSLSLQALQDGSFLAWREPFDPSELPADTVAYQFQPPGDEYLWINGESEAVLKLTPYPSQFAIPTFFDLKSALDRYALGHARRSTCFILSGKSREDQEGIWHDTAQLFLRAKPESTMRRSLEQYLRAALRDHELIDVRPEQNVDESRPVDIRVTWTFSNKIALIEIKWLGRSLADDGRETEYSASRAREGAVQLADYLDRDRPRSTGNVVRGYLVVFDARRRSITPGQLTINEADALHYESAEPIYDADLLSRHDFATPHRFFLEPVIG